MIPPITVAISVVLAVAGAVSAAPATSKDTNSYALYGQMITEYGANPYTDEPRDFAGDVWFERTSPYWSDTPSVYGPVFNYLAGGVVKVTGDAHRLTQLMFQLMAALALLATTALLARRLGWTVAGVAVGLNPLLITFGVNDGHCDVLIGLCVLAGVSALDRRKFWWAGVALGLAALIKISIVPAIFGASVWAFFRWGWKAASTVMASGGALIVLVFVATNGFDMFGPLAQASLRHTRFSVWSPVHASLSALIGSAPPTQSMADVIVSRLASLAVAGVGLYFTWRWRRARTAALCVCAVLVAYQVLGAYTLSWYAAWSLPAAWWALNNEGVPSLKVAAVIMGHGCWLAIAYLSGYFVILVTVVGVVIVLTRRRAITRTVYSWIS